MPDLKQRRISDVGFKIDSQMNVVEANRSFLRMFNTVTEKVNLASYMSEDDGRNFLSFLATFHENMENPYFIVDLALRGSKLKCIVQVTKSGDLFSVSLQELSYLLEMLDKTIAENRRFSSILGKFNSYFFTYDGERYVLQSTKDLADIFEGGEEDFKEFFKNFFMIDMSTENSAEQVEVLFNDLRQRKVNQAYQILNEEGIRVKILTASYSTRTKNECVALISTDKTIASETLFSEKYDGLTNLFNKKTITEMIENKINVSKQSGTLFIIDVDKFKECNDSFGHAFGDKVLVAVSKIIRETVDGFGCAGRIGGDEFICFIDKTDEEEVRTVARNIRLGIQWAIPSINPSSVVTSSIGISRVPMDCRTYEEAFQIADKCLYIAKSHGRNCYIIYNKEKHGEIIRQNEEKAENLLSGKTYAESVEAETKILITLNETLKHKNLFGEFGTIMPMLLDYLEVHKITMYRYENGGYSLFYSSGHDDVNFRHDYLTEDYFKYYNDYGFFHVDNVNVFDTLDKERFSMYLTDKVSSTLEVLCENENKPNILVCYDVFKPAQTFPKRKIVFGIMVARFIARNL